MIAHAFNGPNEVAPRGNVFLSFDNFGNAMAVGAGQAVRPDPDEVGLRVGLPRILALLSDLDIRASFFVEGWNGIHHPDVIESILAGGHDIGLHGWVHENWASLTAERAETLLWDGVAALRSAGATVRGFRAPNVYRGEHTARLLGEMGFAYDSSIVAGVHDTDDPRPAFEITRLPNGVVSLPWRMEMIDGWHYMAHPAAHPEGPRTPDQALEAWLPHVERTAQSGGLLTFIFHPRTSFVDEARVDAVRRLLTTIRENPSLRFRTGIELALEYQGVDQPIG